MSQFNIHTAKTHLSRLVDRAANGENIVIARAGRPVARIVAFEGTPEPRKPGLLRGKISITENFDDPLDGEDAWYTSTLEPK